MTVDDDAGLLQILTTSKTIASVGVSSNPEKPSSSVFEYLLAQGFQMIPINPAAAEVMGVKTYRDLRSVPGAIDVVQVFRRPEDVPPVVEEAIAVGAKVVWMQEDVVNEAAARAAEAAGLKVVMDRCMRKTHIRLLGASRPT